MRCYICNKLLKAKGQVENEKSEAETHYEHIIHNALRGKIGSEQILCKNCGNALNEEIDVEFVKFFSPITEQIKDYAIPKDHNKNSANSIFGQMRMSEYEQVNEVLYRNGVVTFPKPSHFIDWENKKVVIFANAKVLTAYERKVLKEIQDKGHSENDYNIKKVSTIDDGIFIPYFGKDVNDLDEKIALGFIKIAAEFALSKGIERDQLKRILKISEDGTAKLTYDRNIISYTPQGAIDRIYEFYKPLLEPNYPTHTLILFTHQKNNGNHILYCYIELFSTFQDYVILNHDYDSEVFEVVYQSVLKAEILSIANTDDIMVTLRNVYKRLDRIHNEQSNLDEIETNISGGIATLPDDLQNTLTMELDNIDNLIINQNFYKEDFNDENYDLTPFYKRYFYNVTTENCESTPIYLTKASRYAEGKMSEYVQEYYQEKVSRLLQFIYTLKAITD